MARLGVIALLSLSLSTAVAFSCGLKEAPRRAMVSRSVSPARPQMSAAVLPVAYAGVAAALVRSGLEAGSRAEVGVYVSTALSAVIDFAPTAAAQLASSKRAVKTVPPASSGIAKQRRQAAKTWHAVVRFKLVGQLAGLVYMTIASSPAGVLRGAAAIAASNFGFWALGAGRSRHDADASWEPVPEKVVRALAAGDVLACSLALVAAAAPIGSRRFVLLSKCYSFVMVYGVIEKLPEFAMSLPVWLGLKPKA